MTQPTEINAGYVQDANDILQEAMEKGFETVIVFGFKDGKIHIVKSIEKRSLETIGALEITKQFIWDDMNDG